MRHKKVNEGALSKTIAFLTDIQLKCDGKLNEFTTSQLHGIHGVSRRTFAACKALGIVRDSGEDLEWIKGNPDRPMGIQILDYILHSNKKEVVTPLLPEYVTTLNNIAESLKTISQHQTSQLKSPQNTPMLNRALQQSSMQGNGLFADVDSKQKERVYIAGQIAAGVYSKDIQGHQMKVNNEFIIKATDDLLAKLYDKYYSH